MSAIPPKTGKKTTHNPKSNVAVSTKDSKSGPSDKGATKGKSTKKNPGKSGKKTGSGTQPPTRQTDNKLHIVLAAVFLCTIVLSGLFIVTNWPVPPAPTPANTQLEQLPPNPHYPDNQLPPIPPSAQAKINIEPAVTKPQIAIIIDDLGLNYTNSSAAINLPLPITCAIIPGEPYSTQIMELAHKHQHEIIVHLPMEPLNYPQNNPGDLALFTNQTDEELISRTQNLLSLLPLASGVNNHMGSALTQDADKMDIILAEIKKKHLFFVDSLTIGSSVAYQEAQRLEIPTAKRNVFLDNERDVSKILLQLDNLIRIATTMHSAIGICHPYPETIAALTEFCTKLDTLNIEIVPASQLVH